MTNTSSSSTTANPSEDAIAHREEMKKLLREASSMLSKIQLMAMKIGDTNKATEDLELLLRATGMDQHGLALLDSGASHPFRNPSNPTELSEANKVNVELAGGRMVELKQTHSGTLLKADGEGPQAPIVPLGSLVQQLGCSITWSRRQGLKVVHPQHGVLKVRMKGNCPMISELEALRLITEIEEKNLGQLQQNTVRSLWSSCSPSTSPTLSWSAALNAYVNTGIKGYAYSALMDPSCPIALETETERFSFVGPSDLDLSDSVGMDYLKSLPVNRKMRRRLKTSRWIVHLYDGKNDIAKEALKKMETDEVVVLEIDIQSSRMFNMKGWSNTMRALLWASCRGQIEGVLGGPPRDENSELKKKLLYLWVVAQQGAERENLRKPFLFMELPGKSGWWKTEDWGNFRDEFQISHVCVDAGGSQLFHGATNLNLMNYLRETLREGASPPRWNTTLMNAIAEGVREWHRWPDQVRQAQLCKMDGRLEDMTEKDLKRWARHVRDGHVPFNKRCRTCVVNAGSSGC